MDDITRAKRLEKRRESYRRHDAKRRQTPEYKEKQREYHRMWRLENRERLLAEARARHAENPEKANARSRRWKAANLEKVKRREMIYRKRSWARMTPDQRDKKNEAAREWRARNPHRYEALWRRREAKKEAERVASAGRPRPDTCEVCARDGKIVFDHCHKSGRFRGWLCDNCNVVLGRVADDPNILCKLIAYLER